MRNTSWTDLIMEDTQASVDPQSYHGHGVQFPAVCTARSREVYTYQQFGVTYQMKVCGMGCPRTAVAFLPFHVEFGETPN